MKIWIILSLFSSALFAANFKLQLNEKQSYELYHYLQLPEEVTLEKNILLKKGDSVECKRQSDYPGDFEYSCEVRLKISESGTVITE